MAFITLDKWGLNLKTKEKCSGKKRSYSCPASGLSFSFPLSFSPVTVFQQTQDILWSRGFHALSETDQSFTPKGPKDQTFLFLNRNIWY